LTPSSYLHTYIITQYYTYHNITSLSRQATVIRSFWSVSSVWSGSLWVWGHPLKGTCQEKKVVRKQEEAFFLGEDAAARMGVSVNG
jgi:hypothetical protein